MENLTMNRRRFMRNMLVSGSAAYAAGGMQLVNAATAQDQTDYKALVCVFLFGGNDSFNMLTPLHGQARTDYENVRGGLARPLGLEIFPRGQSFEGGLALDIEMAGLKDLFDQGKLAIQGNVGPLIEPVLDEQGNIRPDSSYPKGLYAHDASQQNWMRGADLAQKGTGWGGRVLDAVEGENSSNQAFMSNISLAGSNFWQAGALHSPYSIPRDGKIQTNFMGNGNITWIRTNAIENLRRSEKSNHRLKAAFGNLFENAMDNNSSLVEQLADVEESTIVFPGDNGLAQDLKAVSKMIEVGRNNGLSRQVFFVGLGGFDTHNNQSSSHPNLLRILSEAMATFYDYSVEKGLENNITTFTMSDFGRSIRSNGDGTDHGWAGHQFILGGAVDGGRIYGDMPLQSSSTNPVPTTSNEQMFASLAKWYGVTDDQALKQIFPNLKNFNANPIDYFG
ncbi:DUF1501 domain-containing protein [Colwellia sp. RE-S-Sl-9]